jgi:putative membrane protein
VKRCAAALACFAAGTAFGHEAAFHDGQAPSVWSAWTLDPLVLAPLVLAAFLYGKGSLRFGAREACFAAGMAALFFSLVWPLDVLGEQLFSAHMAQHLALMNVAAPLLVLGAPLAAMLRALPLGARRALARLGAARRWRTAWAALCGLTAATALQQLALWTWHTPRGVALALEIDAVHIAMHTTLLAAALLFWTAVLRPRSGRYWGSIAALVITLKVSGLVCIVLLLQPVAIYPAYGSLAAAWGLAPTEDEQLGWGLMMIVGSVSYLAAALTLAGASLARLERSYPG